MTRVSFIIKAHVADDESTLVGGSAKNPYRLLKYLAPLITIDRVIYFDGKHSGRESYRPRLVRVRYAKLYVKTLLQNLIAVGQIFRSFRDSDVVQCHHPHYGLSAALMKKCAFKRVKFVVKAHGTALPELRANRYRGIKGAVLSLNAVLHRWHDTFVLKQADVVLCSSEFQRQEMISIYGLSSDRIRCIYNGYDPQFVKSAEYGRDALGDLRHRVVFCGRVVPKKGLQYAISLFHKVAKDVPDARLLMLLGKRQEVEDPSTYAVVQAAARRDRRIEIKHDLSEPELYAEFGKATLGLITSQNYESIPTVLFEMVSSGLPVFATYAWGIPEILPESFGLSGEIEQDANKILSFLEDRAAKRKTLEVTNFVRQRFDYRVLVREYLSIYEELAQGAFSARKHGDTRA